MMRTLTPTCILLGLIALPAGAAVNNATAARASGAITIDGKMTEPAWAEAPKNPPLVSLFSGETPPENLRTTFKVLYDDQGVYFGLRGKVPDASKIVTKAGNVLDAAVWGDDDMEVFIDTHGDRMEYYQFAANTAGAQCDLYRIEGGNTGKSGYNPRWNVGTSIRDKVITFEMFIPFAALHFRTLKPGKQTWTLSVARMIPQDKKFNLNAFNKAKKNRGFHDPISWGTLAGIEVPAGVYTFQAENPTYATERAGNEYRVNLTLPVRNTGAKPRRLKLRATVGERRVEKAFDLKPGAAREVLLPPLALERMGKTDVVFSLLDATDDRPVLTNLSRMDLEYNPVRLTLLKPEFRDTIYFSDPVDQIKAVVAINHPADKLANVKVKTTLTAGGNTIFSKTNAPDKRIELAIPADKLAEGEYVLKTSLVDAGGKAFETAERRILKLGFPPGVEARINRKMAVLINGTPLFIRGWYGNLIYMVPDTTLPGARLPRSVNLMMSASDSNAIRRGYFGLVGLSRVKGLEESAKADKPLPGETKRKVIEIVRAQKYTRNIIGYYLSDEPECRGLSAGTLRELYELVKREDPYRLCFIVSRAPDVYIESCDIISPHPYLNPRINENGRREFSNLQDNIHRKMQTAYKAIAGRAKALWCTPQVFSYGGEGGRGRLSVFPDFDQVRWSLLAGVANHAMGIVPFMFSEYWADVESRIGVTYVFETLAWLEEVLVDGEKLVLEPAGTGTGTIDAVAHRYQPRNGRTQIYIIATNRNGQRTRATFKLDALKKYDRVFVVRENRTIEVKDGAFFDEFGPLGARVYTTNDRLPWMKSLDAIKAEIAAAMEPKPGNLLRDGKTDWGRGVNGRNARIYGDALADGTTTARGWFPWYGQRKELLLVFPKGVKFKTFVFYSANIAAMRLEAWSFGKWRPLVDWKNIHQYRTEWTGDEVVTVKVRLTVEKIREGYRPYAYSIPCITEIEMY